MPDPTPAPAPSTPPPAQARYITIHGHFYQPPRENPWLETVETQDSAAPYHDWNERITAECYAPNGAARIVNAQNQIIRIINNYSRISFNFGPTLLSWLDENASRAYKHILEADRRSRLRFGGHGSAMAQVYNHIIMPLANTRDRVTQIRWGIADFESRFHRKPLLDAMAQIHQLQRAARSSRRDKQGHQRAQTGTVHMAKVGKVQHDPLVLRDQLLHPGMQQVGIPHHQLAVAVAPGQYRPSLQRRRRAASRLRCRTWKIASFKSPQAPETDSG